MIEDRDSDSDFNEDEEVAPRPVTDAKVWDDEENFIGDDEGEASNNANNDNNSQEESAEEEEEVEEKLNVEDLLSKM